LAVRRPADRGDEQVPKANGNQRTGGKGTGGGSAGKTHQIQLEVGAPLIAPEKITFPNGL
jgi:hypothetical protein